MQYRLGNVDAFQVRVTYINTELLFKQRNLHCGVVVLRKQMAKVPPPHPCVVAFRWDSVHLCSRGPADRHVPLQVQADETDPHVQGSQASHLLPLQHCEYTLTHSISVHVQNRVYSQDIVAMVHKYYFCETRCIFYPNLHHNHGNYYAHPHVRCHCMFPGPCGQGSRLWLLGTRLEGVALLHEGHHPFAGKMVGQLAGQAV